MTIYRVQGPDGRVYRFEGPEGATPEEVEAAAEKHFAPKTGWSGSLQKGMEGLTSPVRTAAGAVFGDPNEAARAALEREKTAALRYPEQVSMEKVKEAYQRGLLPAAGEVLRQIPHAIAEQLPQLGTTLASGMAGARLGALAGPVGAVVGGIGGMAAPSLVQQLGGNIQRQAQVQTEAGQPIDVSMARAVGAAIPQAGLDVLETRLLLGSKLFTSLTGKALGEVTKEQAEKLAKDGLLKTLGKGTVRGVVSEVPTEVTQQMLERWQAGLDLTSPEALAEYGDTVYQTALLGPLGIPGQFAQRSQAREMVAPPPRPSETPATQPGAQPTVTPGEDEYVAPEAVVEKTTPLKTSGKKAGDVTLDEAINDIAAYQQKLATGDYRGDRHKTNIENKIKRLEARRAELEAAGQPAEETKPEVKTEPGVIDAAAIASLGIKGQGSRRVKKALIGLDLNTPDGKATFNTLFQSPGLRFNEEAVTALFGGPITPVEVAAPAAPVPRKPILQGDQGGASADGQADRAGTPVPVRRKAAAPGVAKTELAGVGESGGPAARPAGGTPGGDVALAEAQAKADAEAQARADAEAKAKADAEAQARADAEAAVERQKKVLEEAATKDREIKAQRRKEIAGKAQAALAQEGEAPKKKDKTVMNPALIRREGLELLTKEDMSPGDYTRGVEYLVDSKADDLLKLLGIPKKDIDTARQRMNAANIKALTEESFSEIATPITRDRYKALLDFLIEEPNPKAKADNLRRLRKGQVSEKDIKESEARVAKANVARKLAASKKDKTKKNLDQLQRGDRRDISRLQERYFDLQEDIAFTQDQVSELKVRGEPYATEEQHAYSQMVALEEVKAAAKERGIEFPESRSGIRHSRIMEGGRRPTKGSLARDVANRIERILRDGSALERIVTVVQSPSQLPEEVRQAKDFSDNVRGVTHRGRVYLVADNIESKRELGVFLHEVGAHLGFDRIMSKTDRQSLADQVRSWVSDKGVRGEAARVAVAKGKDSNDEVIAYAVEELVNRGVFPTGLRAESTWLRRVLGAIREFLEKIGVLRVNNIPARELVDTAFGAAQLVLGTDRVGTEMDTRLSVKSDKMGATGTAKAWVEFAEAKKIADFGKIKTVEDARQAAEADYKKTISEIPEFDADAYLSGAMEMEEQFLPEQVRDAVRQYKEGDKENAVGQLLADVKRMRKNNIERWKNYLENVNEDARVDPFWRSYVARSVIGSFDTTKPNTGETFNAAALAEIYGKFLDGNAPNFTKAYRAAKLKATANLVELGTTDNGWRKVPRTSKEDPEFAERVAEVQAISSESWCTKTYNAAPYIEGGDFWVYISNGKPELAIRFDGSDVAEIQGRANNGTIPYQYAGVVEELVESGKIKNLNSHTKNALKQATEKAKTLQDLEKNTVRKEPYDEYGNARPEYDPEEEPLVEPPEFPPAVVTAHIQKDGSVVLVVESGELQLKNYSPMRDRITKIIGDVILYAPTPALTTVGGNAYITKGVRAPALTTVNGDVAIYEGGSAPALTTVSRDAFISERTSAPALTTVGGDVSISKEASIPALTTVGGDAVIRQGAIAPALTTVNGDVAIYERGSAPALTTVGRDIKIFEGGSAPALTTVGRDINISEGVSVPALTTVNGDIYVSEGASVPALTTVSRNVEISEGASAPALTTVGGNVDISKGASAPALITVGGNAHFYERASAPALTTVGGNAYVYERASAPALTTVGGNAYVYKKASVPALTTVGGDANIQGGASVSALTTVGGNAYVYKKASVPALTTVGGDVAISIGASAPALTTVGGDVEISKGASAPDKLRKPSQKEAQQLANLSDQIKNEAIRRIEAEKGDEVPAVRFSTGSAALDLGVQRRNDALTRSGDQPLYKQVWDALGSAEKRKKLYMKFRNSVEDQSASVKDKLLEKGFARPVMGLAFASRSMDMAAHSMLTGAIKLRRKDNMFVIPPGKHDSIRTVYEQVQKIADKLPSGSLEERMTTAKRIFDLGGIHLRNESLSPEDRAKFKFPPEDIAAGKDAMAMYGEEIRRGMEAWTNYKNGLLDAAQVAGRLSAEEVHELKKAVDYVPWYRVLEDAKFGFETKSSAKKFFSGLQDTGKIHELMGGSIEDRPIGNLLENMERLSFWLVNASMKNHAANQVVDALLTVDVERMGSPDATHTEKGTPVDKKRVIFTYRNGEKTYYQMGDELDTDAFTSTIQFTGSFMKLAAKGTNFLRKGVTYMPNFVVSQLFQDSFRVTTFSGAKNPFAVGLDTYSQFLKEMKGDKLSEVLASLGLVGRADYIFGDEASRVGAELDRTHTGFKKLASSGFRMLDRMTRASDMAQRRAVFQKTLEETGDEALAAYKAIEIINFQTHGKAQAIQALRHLVPFTNAYIQGMSVTLRSMFGSGVTLQERRAAMLKFYATGIKIAALSAMYAALVGDDDDYEQMPDHEKISSFMIPGTREMIKQFTGTDPGGNIRIPVPMDFVGLAFKALPEAGVNTFLKEAAGSEVDYAKVRRGLSNAAINAAFPPGFVPQIVKPSLEVWANKSFFTDRPIVGWGLRNREREQQFTASTSEFAKILAGVIPLAPVQIDHLARGYLGMGGGLAMDLASSLLDGTTPGERPSKFLNETPVIKSFLTSNSASGLKEDYYELREKATMVADTVRTLATRDPEKLLEYIEKDGKREQLMVAQSGVLRQIDSALGDIRKVRDIIDNNKNMSADDKRDKLDQLERLEVVVLSRMQLTALRKLAKL